VFFFFFWRERSIIYSEEEVLKQILQGTILNLTSTGLKNLIR